MPAVSDTDRAPPLEAPPRLPEQELPLTLQLTAIALQGFGLQLAPVDDQEPALHDAVSDPE